MPDTRPAPDVATRPRFWVYEYDDDQWGVYSLFDDGSGKYGGMAMPIAENCGQEDAEAFRDMKNATLTHLTPPADEAVEEAPRRCCACGETTMSIAVAEVVDDATRDLRAALTTAQQEAEKAREALREACDDMFDLDLDALREQWAIADSAGRLTPSEYRAEWVSRKVDEYLATHDGGDAE